MHIPLRARRRDNVKLMRPNAKLTDDEEGDGNASAATTT
jgi:hypothetical protein